MSDLNYNINANVTGGEKVGELRDDIEAIEEAGTVNVNATGVTETAESLESISTTTAAEKLDDVGVAADSAATFGDKAAGAFQNMVAAIGLVTIATEAAGLAINAVKERLDAIARVDAWNEAQVEGYKAAIQELGVGLDAIQEHLTGIADQDFEDVRGFILAAGGATLENPAASFGALGISISEVMDVIRGGEPELDAMRARLEEIGLTGDVTGAQMGFLESQQSAYSVAVQEGAQELVFWRESQDSANRALQEMLTNRDPMSQFTAEWDLLKESMSDGSIDTTAAANALNTLSSELGLTTDEVLELARADLDEVAAGARAFADAWNSIDFRATELQGATTAFDEFTTQLFAATNEAEAREAAFDRLAASVEGVGLNFSATTEAGREQSDALEQVSRVINTDLAQAYDAANGSQEEFIATATQIGEDTLARLKDEMNLTTEQVDTLRNALGLTATDYEARFDLAGAEAAQLQLGLLQGAIEGLPDNIEQQVTLDILEGDFVEARDTIAQFYTDNPVPLTTEADTSGAETDIESVTDADHETTIVADADTVQAATDLLDTADEPRTALIVAHARTAGASIDLKALADEDRTAYIDVATGAINLPSAAALRNRIGPIYVPIIGRWSTRIEGSRPGP